MSVANMITADVLHINADAEVDRITNNIRDSVFSQCKRKGAVVAVSGGIDSSLVAALCVRALGPERVVALFLPEADSSGESLRLGKNIAETLGIRSFTENITPILEGAGCYRRRDEAIRGVVPEYGDGYKMKIALPDLLSADRYAIYNIVTQSPAGEVKKTRLSLDGYLGIVASTNFKQRTRTMMAYYYADRFHYAVAGTPNRLEYDQGFFVKGGDGLADFKPIAHLYKSQVYQLAAYLGVPEEIRTRPSTTDTYSLEQSQEEFYFSMPLAKMDLCLYGKDHGIPATELSSAVELSPEQVHRVYEMIDAKRKTTRYLHLPPVLVEDVR